LDTQNDMAGADPRSKLSNPKDAVGIRKWRQFAAVPMTVIAEVGVALLEGARKYGRHNYRVAGVRASVYVDAAFGHIVQWWEGEDIDSDSKLSHITKAIASLVVLRDAMIQDKLNDDRPPKAKLDRVRDDLQQAVDRIFDNWPTSVPPYMERRGPDYYGPGPGSPVREDALRPLGPYDESTRLAWLEIVKNWEPAAKDPSAPLVFADYADLEKRIMAQLASVTGIANFPPDVTSRSVQPLLEEMAAEGWTFYLEPVSGTIQATRPATEDRPEQALSLDATPVAVTWPEDARPPSPTDGHDSTPVEFATRRKVAMPPVHVAEYTGVTSADQVERVIARDLAFSREPYRPVEDLGDGGWADVDPESLEKAASGLGQAVAGVYGISDAAPPAAPPARQISAGDLAFANDDPPPPAPPAFGHVRDAYVDFLKLVLSGDTQHPEYLTSRAQLETFAKALGSSNQAHDQPRTHSTRDQQKYHWQFLLGTLARLPGFSEKSASAIGELWPRHLQDWLAHKADML
jgi:Domain of unknown function (DUF5664)